MVAIVVGNSLGLNTSSASVLGQQGIFGTATVGRNQEAAYLNIGLGNLVLEDQDAGIAYDGGLHMAGYNRVYNSTTGTWGGLLASVSLSKGAVNTDGSSLLYTDFDGSQQHFNFDSTQGCYVSTEGGGAHTTILYDAQTAQFTRYSPTASTYSTFDSTAGGRILQTHDIGGAGLVTYQYNADNTLASITAGDQSLHFQYDARARLVSVQSTAISDASLHTVTRYGYDDLGRLNLVTVDLTPEDNSTSDGNVYATIYSYDGTSNRIASISQSDGSVSSFSYVVSGGKYLLSQITDPTGGVTKVSYSSSYPYSSATVSDPLGYSTQYGYDNNGQLTGVLLPLVGSETLHRQIRYEYDAAGNVTRSVYPGNGELTDFTYDSHGNLIKVDHGTAGVITYTYGSDPTRPGQLLNQTVYLAPSWQPSDPLTTRNVYDASGFLRFIVTPQGRVTEYRYDALGARTSTIEYAADYYPVDGLAPATSISLDDALAWSATADHTKVLRTDVTYNAGSRYPSSSITYSAIAEDGSGIADGTESHTRYVYDTRGHLISTVSPTQGTTTYTYDGLGRVVTVQDANGAITLTQYDDANNRTVLHHANGLTTTSTYDRSGRLISVMASNAASQNVGETTYRYDADGRLLMTTGPTGTRHFYLYDDLGRKVAEVDSKGALTEYVYDLSSLVTKIQRYVRSADLTLLVDSAGNPLSPKLSSVRPLAVPEDQVTTQAYDSAGRLTSVSGGTAQQAQYIYDGAGRVVSVLDKNGTQYSYRYYDNDGRLVGSLDSLGYLTEYRYDAAGNEIESISYANATSTPMSMAVPIGQSIDAVRPAANPTDIHTYKIYNARGQSVGSLDGEGYLTEYVYDGSGNLTTQIQYAQKGPAYTSGMPLSQARPATSPQDRVQVYTYTRTNLVSSHIDTDGTKTLYVYDDMGKLTSTIVAAGTSDARAVLSHYDAQGLLVEQLSGEGAAKITGEQTQAEIDAIWQQYGTRYTYDAVGRRTSATNAAGQTTLYYYDSEGLLRYTINALGEVEGHVYDTLGQLVETTRYAGRIPLAGLSGGTVDSDFELSMAALADRAADSHTSYTYKTDGKVWTEKDSLGTVTTYLYDSFGRLTSESTTIVGARAHALSWRYDATGRLVQFSDGQSGSITTKYQYDAFGRAIVKTMPNGAVTTYDYDHNGRTITTTDPLTRTTTGYDAFGNVLWQQDAMGHRTTYAYDPARHSVTVTSPEGISVTTIDNAFGQTVEVIDGNGNATHYTYDLDGNATGTITALGQTHSQYDKIGRLIETTDANGVDTVYDYDAANRLVRRTVDPEGLAQTTLYAFDAKGEQVETTDPNGTVTRFSYDGNGQVTKKIVDPAGLALTTTYSYDTLGNVVTMVDPNGIRTTYSYNEWSQRVSETIYSSANSVTKSPGTYYYNAAGQVAGRSDGSGNITRYFYDAAGRPTLTVDPAGDVTENVYGADGHIARVVYYAKAISVDGLSYNTTTEAQIRSRLQPMPGTDTTEFRYYDADGRLTATVDGAGGVVAYVYDNSGNVVLRTAYASPVSTAALAGGAPLTLPGVDIAHDQRTRTVYDALNRPIYSVDATGAVVAYTYDAAGNVTERIAYANRIPAATPATAAAISAAIRPDSWHDARIRNVYDAAGRVSYTVDGVGAVTHNVYDNNGNVVRTIQYATLLPGSADPSTVPASPSDRAQDYVYDTANRLILTVDASGAATRRILDGNGNAVQVVRYSQLVPATVPRIASALLAVLVPAANDRVTTYAYDAANRVALMIDPALGVTAYIYTGTDKVSIKTEYATPLNIAGATLEGLPLSALTLTALQTYITTSPDDRVTKMAYDPASRLVYTVDAMGYVAENVYDSTGRVVQTRTYANPINLPYGANIYSVSALLIPDSTNDRQTFFMYDAAGEVLGTTDSLGKTEFYTYDGAGNKLTYQNKNGAIWHYDYDAAGHLVTESGPPVNLTATTTNAAGGLSYSTSSMVSVVTRYVYDALGNLVARTEAAGRPEEKTTRYVYDAAGRQIQTLFAPVNVYAAGADNVLTNGATGTAGRVETQNATLTSDVLYDAFGDAIAGRDTAGNVSYKTYDKLGNITYEVDPEGYVTAYQYDTFGEQSMLVRYANKTALSQANTFTGMSAATITATVNAAGIDHGRDRSIITHYDALGRAIEIIEPTSYSYDSSAAVGAQYFTAAEVTRNQYNAFGQVVAVSKLVNPLTQNWATTTQYYDRHGNMTAKVDPLGYLTTMTYDSRNNLLSQREYAKAATSWTTAGYTLPTVSDQDRVTNYTYDLLDQKTSETRVNVEYSAGSNGTFTRGNLTTRYTYDAVGNQTSVVDAAGNVTYSYYDALGRVTATAEPSHSGTAGGGTVTPLTEYGRDALGNIVETRQYANGVLTATTTGYTANASGADRITLARFDSRGKQIQTQDAQGNSTYMSYNAGGLLAKQWRPVTGNDGVTRSWFQAYQYDRLGQQTHVIDPASTAVLNSGITTSFSSGTISSKGFPAQLTVSGTSSININWSSLINTTGGTVRVQVYYNTLSTLHSDTVETTEENGEGGEGGYTTIGTVVTTGSPSIATSRTVDFSALQAASGANISWTEDHQAVGGIDQVTYIQVWQMDNATGQWVSRWAGSPSQASGTGVSDISQAQAGFNDTATTYNAFGEVVNKGSNGGAQEYYEYDNAGNVVRTNSGDGVDKILLHDLMGNQTAVISSDGNTNVRLFGSLDQAAAAGAVQRTDTIYDQDGNALRVVEPARTVYQGGVQVSRDYTGAVIDSSATMTLVHELPDGNGGYYPGPINDEAGKDENGNWTDGSIDVPMWSGTNTIRLSWTSLANLGDGDVRVQVTYQSSGGTNHTLDQTYPAGAAQSGVVFSWNGAAQNTTDGGVSRITSMVVYKRDAYGNWQQVANQQGTFGNTGNFIDVAAPVDPAIGIQLQLADASGNWFGVPLIKFGDSYRYDAAGLGFGNYQYRVIQVARDGSTTISANGTLSLAPPALVPLTANVGFGVVAPNVFSWPSFGAAYTAEFRYKPVGSATWISLPVGARGMGQDGVDIGPSGVGTYDYELLIINKATGAPYAHATGQIAKGAAVPDQWVPPAGLPPLPAGYLSLGANTTVTWTEPGAYDYGTAILVYTLPSGAVGSVVMAKNIINVYGESAGEQGGAESSSFTTTFSFPLGQLPAGTTSFTINYYAAGSGVPTNHAVGTIYQGPTSPGYYYTRYYTVSVGVQVWVPPTEGIPADEGGEGGEAGTPGYWTTVYHDEQRSEQVWVNGTTPAPGMTQWPTSYQPGYTIKGHPATYVSSNTSASNPYPISVPSGPGGATGVQTPIGQNGGYITSRPTVIRTYDRWGNVLSVTDPRSANWITNYTYNANNQMTSEVRPTSTGAPGAGPTTRLYYDALGRQVAQRDANGYVNGSVYDAAGDLIQELHADGGVVRYDYNAFGDKVAWVDAMGNRTGYTYDNMDRLLTTSHAVVASYTVNGAFQLVNTAVSSLVERNTYDQMGHRLTTTDGAGATTYYRYDMRGNVVGVRQPGIGVEVRSAYDAQGHKIFESDANSNGATWTYDYFGHLIGHKDVGGAQYFYHYNNAWQLFDESNTRGQHFTYSYDAAGQVTQINDLALGQVTQYQYDNAGNKIREKTTQGGVVYQDNYLAYDALGLLRDVTDGGHVHETIDYDANGNRVHVGTTYLDSASNMQGKNLWYGYDSMNRQTTVDGADASLNINAAQGHKLTFDYNGNRITDTYWNKTISAGGASAGFTTEYYIYDGMSRLITATRDGFVTDRRYYDGASRVVQSGIDGAMGGSFYLATGLDNTFQQNQYDGAGRLYDQRVTMMTSGGWAEKSNTTYSSYDNAGNVLQYVVENFDQQHYVNTYTYSMQRFEGYVQGSLSGTSTVYQPGTTTYGYDVNGNLTSVVDQRDSTKNQTLVNDVSGKILQRTQNGTTIRSLVVNGELMATVGPTAGQADFTPTYRPIDGTNPQAAPGLYTVQAGDTLQSIAQTAYGDSKLWYLVADANGLSGDRDLRVGQSINIPNRVTGNSNDYKSFKPYNPSKIIGDTTPTMPVPEPEDAGGGGGCGGIGTIIVAVVAVVATVFTAGALAPVAAAAAASIGTFGAGVALAAVSAAVGSIVSQGVGMALGVQNKFSWSAVGTSALEAGVTYGVGAGISAAAESSNSAISSVGKALTSSSPASTIARVAVSNTITQGVAVAVGAQSKFSWTGVAASAVGAGVGSTVHTDLGSQFGNDLGSHFVSAAAAGTTAAVLSGGKANYVQVAVDAFGNALGNSIADQLSIPSVPMGDTRGSFDGLAPASNSSGGSSYTDPADGFALEQLEAIRQGFKDSENIKKGTLLAKADTGIITDVDASGYTDSSEQVEAGGQVALRGLNQAKVQSILQATVPTPDVQNDLLGLYLPANLDLGSTIEAPNLGIESAFNSDSHAMLTSYTEASRNQPSIYAMASSLSGDVYVDPDVLPFSALVDGITDFGIGIAKGTVNSIPKTGMALFHAAAVGESMNYDIVAGMDPSTAYTRANAAMSGLSDGTIVSYNNDLQGAGGTIGEFAAPFVLGSGLNAIAKFGITGSAEASAVLRTGVGRVGPGDNANFASRELLNSHFERHGTEFDVGHADEYLDIGRDIMNNGHEVNYLYKGENRTGYISFMRNRSSNGEALFGFVGTNSEGAVTTIHTKPRTELFSLMGDKSQSVLKAFRTDTIGSNSQLGWKYPYSW